MGRVETSTDERKNKTKHAYLYKCNLFSSLSTILLLRQLTVYIRPSEALRISSVKGPNHEIDPK